jgi:outer membrane protein assembly factor BamB
MTGNENTAAAGAQPSTFFARDFSLIGGWRNLPRIRLSTGFGNHFQDPSTGSVVHFHLPRIQSAGLLAAMKPLPPKAVLLTLVMGVLYAGPASAQTPPPAATKLWTAVFPGYQNSSSSTPAIAPDGTIYVGTFHGDFMAYSPDGAAKWSFKTGREIKSSPAVAGDGTVYFGSRDRNLYAFTPAGKLKWTFATGAWVDSSPAIAADGTVYFGGWDKFLYALKPDGSLKWKTTVEAIVDSSPAIAADGTIYFGAHNRKFYALHPDGSVRWTFLTGGVITSSPAIGVDGTIYFSSVDGNLYALNPDGSERWHRHTGGATESSPVLGGDGDVCLGQNDGIEIVTGGGDERWHYGSPMLVDTSAAAVTNRFYLSVPWRTVQAVMAGKLAGEQRLWEVDLESYATSSLTVSADGIVYVCSGFQLFAIRPPGELPPPAKSSWPMFRGNPRHTGRVEN